MWHKYARLKRIEKEKKFKLRITTSIEIDYRREKERRKT